MDTYYAVLVNNTDYPSPVVVAWDAENHRDAMYGAQEEAETALNRISKEAGHDNFHVTKLEITHIET